MIQKKWLDSSNVIKCFSHASNNGRSWIWDVTMTDIVMSSYLAAASHLGSGAMELATSRKSSKYNALLLQYPFGCLLAHV